jgi:hypothetical protein
MRVAKYLGVCVFLLGSVTAMADPTDDTSTKRQIAEMQQQIVELKTQVAALAKQIADVQAAAKAAPPTQPATLVAVPEKAAVRPDAAVLRTWQCWVSPKQSDVGGPQVRGTSYRDYIQAKDSIEAGEMFRKKHPTEQITQVEEKK